MQFHRFGVYLPLFCKATYLLWPNFVENFSGRLKQVLLYYGFTLHVLPSVMLFFLEDSAGLKQLTADQYWVATGCRCVVN